ncbi:MAG: glycosyltransferase family 4 protein [Rickettsiales bacterium]|nr:glycosyltransferase family 4 protein [Rickettsiales bacterium]
MRIVNILFNHKKSSNVNKTLGVERCFVDYTKNLSKNNHQVVSITKPNMVFANEVRGYGNAFYEVGAVNQGDVISIVKMAKIFFKFKPDIIVCHSGRALVLSRLARMLCFKKFPIVVIDHGVNPKKFLKSDFLLTVNSFFSKESMRAGMPKDRSFVIPNMIDVPKDFKKITKKTFRKKIRLGSLGRLFSEKNFDKVLHAIALLKAEGIECEYVIGGVGPEEENLNNIAKKLKISDHFKILGWVEDKKKFFEDIDIFILPSFGETFGIVLLEAMLYSTPIITSNSWGPDEVINHEVDGLKVSKDSPREMPSLLSDAIKRLNNDQKFAKKLAENSYEKFFEKYSSEMVTKKLESIFELAVQKGMR